MKTKSNGMLCRWAIVCGLLVLLLAPALEAADGVATKAGKKTWAKKPEPPLPANLTAEARDILRQLDADTIQARIDRLGAALGMASDKAPAILDALAKENTVPADTLRAELLLWLARGADARDASRKGEMSAEDLGRYAGALLDHADPFVRGLAEWAMAIRLGMNYENVEERIDRRRVVKPWPGQDAPDWYQRWVAIGPDAMLALDYVRQAVALGLHRTTESLLKSAEAIVKRTEALADSISHRNGQVHTTKVREAHRRLASAATISPGDLTAQRQLWLALRRAAREVVLANPDLNFTQIIFGLRQADRAGGNITVGCWNTHAPGGDIVIKTGFAPSNPVRPLLNGRLGPGHVRGLELNWDADKLVFAYAKQAGRAAGSDTSLRPNNDIGGYFGQGVGDVEGMSHLFEVKVDGTGLRQLTDAHYNADQEPCYLPNGDIAFVSDRSNFGSQCAGALEPDNMILNLYRCDPDGRNIRALSNNKDFDRHPHVMDNGQLLFLHWEYQERHLWQTHALWTCRPDGSMTDALYKQHLESGPMSLREARQIRGTQKLVSIACGHHNYDQGAVFLVDYSLGVNAREGMRNVTPGVSGTEGGYGGIQPVTEGGVQDRGGHYMFPYPLSEKSFLVSYSYKQPERNAGQNFALYYIDVWGHKELIHRDKKLSVAFLSPLRATPRPPVLSELPAVPQGQPRWGVVSVADVHADWPNTYTGRVKYLRVSQKVPWPCVRDESKACGFNDLHWMPAAWEPVLGLCDWGAARVIGIVPVEADGSAHFKVPADQPVYFQALDENFLELRRMRSNVTLKAGENRSATFSKRGVALEWMIELCNRQKIDPWFCLPHLADDDYVRNFAKMVKERLDPSLKIYIEYSNEVWNGQFLQSRYAGEQGIKLGLAPKEKGGQAAWYFTAVRSMQVFKIWEDVFGGHERFIRVLPSQAGNSAVSEGVLSFRDAAKHADALAIAPYMPYSIGRGKTADLGEQMKDWTVTQMLDHFEKTAFPDSLVRMAKAKTVADKYGVKLIAYEGGQHMVAFVKNQELVKKISATMHACNRHPRMGEMYRRYYDEWARLGGDVFAVFSSIGQYSNHGAWGLAEHFDSKPADYPKLAATLEWAKKHGQPVEWDVP